MHTPAPGSTHGRPARAPCALSSLAEGVPLSSHRLSHFSLRPQHGPRAASGGEVAPCPDLGAEPPLSAARRGAQGVRSGGSVGPVIPPRDSLVEPSPANGRMR